MAFEVLSTGGEDPVVFWYLRIRWITGQDLYKWQYRFDLGPMGLGTESTNIGGLAFGRSYFIRLYAYNSAGDAWTGKQFEIVTQRRNQICLSVLKCGLMETMLAGTGISPSTGSDIVPGKG